MAMKLLVSTLAVGLLSLFDDLDASQVNNLKVDLFDKYDKKQYPGDVIVQPGVTYQACPTLNAEGIMSYNIKERYEWNDRRLRWEPADYDNIQAITVPLHYLWVPNIKLSASSTVDDVEGLAEISELAVEIRSDGVVRVDRYSHYKSRCFVSSDKVGSSHVWDCDLKFGSMDTYGSETFRMTKSDCDTDMFGPMADQCREVVFSRSTSFEKFSLEQGPTRYWFVVNLRLLEKSRFYMDF